MVRPIKRYTGNEGRSVKLLCSQSIASREELQEKKRAGVEVERTWGIHHTVRYLHPLHSPVIVYHYNLSIGGVGAIQHGNGCKDCRGRPISTV
jgi:hypothetical protein